MKKAKNLNFITKILIALSCLLAVAASSVGLGIFLHGRNETKALNMLDSDSYESIPEIWDESSSAFNSDAIMQLISAIEPSFSQQVMKDMVSNNSGVVPANVLPYSGRDLAVTLQGVAWDVVCMSTDVNDNLILTLWFAGYASTQWSRDSALGVVSETVGSGMASQKIYSTFTNTGSSAFEDVDGKGYSYQAVYGSSYVATQVLGNGGSYYDITTGTYKTATLTSSAKNYYPFYKDFQQSKLTDYIIKPKDVSWQQDSYSGGGGNNDLLVSTGMSGDRYYTAWGNHYLWLPSANELSNIWQVTDNQAYVVGNDSFDVSSGGSTLRPTTTTYYNSYWLRSNEERILGGDVFSQAANENSASGTELHLLRPALHLNLTKIFQKSPVLNSWLLHAAPYFESGEGASCYISTPEELARVAFYVNNGLSYEDGTQAAEAGYTLEADIDLSAYTWVPIGTTANPFRGHFYGQGFHIFGMDVDSSQTEPVGLFGLTQGADIENVNILNGYILGASLGTGGLVGRSIDTNISYCNVNAYIKGDENVGGLVGVIEALSLEETITDCSFSGHISAGDYTGGIAGLRSSSAQMSGTISSCTVSADIYASDYVGGIIGQNEYAACVGDVFNGNIEASNDVGGIVGTFGDIEIYQCIATGTIHGVANVGGLGGNLNNPISATITLCLVDMTIVGQSCVGGFVGVTNGAPAVYECAAFGVLRGDSANNTGVFVGSLNTGGNFQGCSFICEEYKYLGGFSGKDTIDQGQYDCCYMQLHTGGRIAISSELDNPSWGTYFAVVNGINNGLPIQRELYAVAQAVGSQGGEEVVEAFEKRGAIVSTKYISK